MQPPDQRDDVTEPAATAAARPDLTVERSAGDVVATTRTVTSHWELPANQPNFHDVRLRRWSPDGGVDILVEHTMLIAEFSQREARYLSEWLAQPTAGRGLPPDHRPPEQMIEFVAWKLRISIDSFYGRVLLLVPHADPANRRALHQAFPAVVEAWKAWQESDGDFELPPATARFVAGGDVR
jgi:hypothetical protein